MKAKAWRVTLSAVFAGLAIAIIQNKVVPCITVLQNTFEIDAGTAGWLSSAFCVMGIVMAFPGALIVEKIGLKRTGLLSLLFGLIGTGIGILADSVPLLLVSRVIEGAGAGLIAIVVPSLISLWFSPEKRGLPMSIWSTWQIVAQSLCFLFGLSLTDAFGWRGLWGAGGIITILAALFFVLFVHVPETGAGHTQEDESNARPVSLSRGLKNPAVWLVCLAMMFFTLSNFGFVTWVAPSWAVLFSMDPEVCNRYISIMYIFALPISVLFGFVLNHVDHKRFSVISYLLYALISAAAFILPSSGLILPFIILYPFAESAICAAMWTLVPEAAVDSRFVAVAMALFGLLQNVGMLLGPPLSGAVLDRFGIAAVSLAVLIPALIGTGLVALAKINKNSQN